MYRAVIGGIRTGNSPSCQHGSLLTLPGSPKSSGKNPCPKFLSVKTGDEPSDEKHIYINSLPFWRGQRKSGVHYGAPILSAMAHETAPDGSRIVTNFFKDEVLNSLVENTSEESFTGHMNKISGEITAKLAELKPGKDFVLNLGGDHSVSMATLQTLNHIYPDLRVVWIDAHADINSPETTLTGNFHGMPVHYISNLSAVQKNRSQISLDHITFLGVRDLDDAEVEILKEHKVRNYTKDEINERGSDTIISELIEQQEMWKYPIHISFDIDGIDPSATPSTGTAVPEGLSVAFVVELIKRIKETGNLVSMDIVELNPLLGDENDVETTIRSIRTVMKEILL